MGRIRTIKPEFFCNEGLCTLDPVIQLLAAGLLCYADDEGYFNSHPALVKAAVFPLRMSISHTDVPAMLQKLAEVSYVRFGTTADGKRWGHITHFLDHQRISHPKTSSISDMEIMWEASGNFPEDVRKFPEESKQELGNGTGNREQGTVKPSARPKAARRANPDPRIETRHTRVQGMIQTAYREHNEGSEAPWDGSEAKQLQSLLKACPGWPDSQFVQCLDHMYRSDGFPPGTRPREFLPRLPRYLKSPLNQFNREEAPHVSKAEQRQREALAPAAAAYRNLSARDREAFGRDGSEIPALPANGVAADPLATGLASHGPELRTGEAETGSAEGLGGVQVLPPSRGDRRESTSARGNRPHE